MLGVFAQFGQKSQLEVADVRARFGACAFVVLRENGVAVLCEDVEDAFGLERNAMNSSIRGILEQSGIRIAPLKPEEMYERFAAKIGLSRAGIEKFRRSYNAVCDFAREHCLVEGRKIAGLAAAILVIALYSNKRELLASLNEEAMNVVNSQAKGFREFERTCLKILFDNVKASALIRRQEIVERLTPFIKSCLPPMIDLEKDAETVLEYLWVAIPPLVRNSGGNMETVSERKRSRSDLTHLGDSNPPSYTRGLKARNEALRILSSLVIKLIDKNSSVKEKISLDLRNAVSEYLESNPETNSSLDTLEEKRMLHLERLILSGATLDEILRSAYLKKCKNLPSSIIHDLLAESSDDDSSQGNSLEEKDEE